MIIKKEKKRTEIPEKYTWDLKAIYSSQKEIDNDIDEVKAMTMEISKYKGTLLTSSNNLLAFLQFQNNLIMKLTKLDVYAYLKRDEDLSNPQNNALLKEVENLVTKVNEELSFVEPEILKKDKELINKYISENPDLELYRFYLEDILRNKDHVLSDKEESIISSYNSILGGYNDIYNLLTNSEMKFGTFKDEENNFVELTTSNYKIYSQSQSKRVRKTVYKLLYNAYKQHNLIISEALINHMKTENLNAEIHGYKDALESSLSKNNIKPEIYINHITRIKNNNASFIKYLQLFKKVNHIKKIEPYDLNLPLAPSSSKKYKYEDAENIIVNGLSILGKDYTDLVKKCFRERWIDVYHNAGKISGAFSMPNYFPHPYILTNYENEFYDVSTLAHEIGHAINGYYSNQKQPFMYHDNPIFLAEIASTTNEILLSRYLIDHSDSKEEKLHILDHLIDLYLGNLFSTSKRAWFELEVHERLAKKDVLTNEDLNSIWEHLNYLDYQDNCKPGDSFKYGWMLIPHFYMNYYNYQYSTGISIASYITSRILNNDQEYINKYKEFLKVGSSMYPLDALKMLDIDMNDDKIVNSAIKTFDNLIEEFTNIYNQ